MGAEANDGQAVPAVPTRERDALTMSERQAYEARIQKLEAARRNVEQLVRFQIEAYKARIADLKLALARQRGENRVLRRELGVSAGRSATLQRRLREIGRQIERRLESERGETRDE